MGGDKSKRTDATRQERKAKKRKLEDAIPDVPGDNDIEVAETDAATEQAPKKMKRDDNDSGEDMPVVKEKKSRRQKREHRESKGEEQSLPGTETDAKAAENENGEEPKKSKKARKAERRAREAAEAAATKKDQGEEPAAASNTAPPASGGTPAVAASKEKMSRREKSRLNGNGEKSEKAARFIVFIGTYLKRFYFHPLNPSLV
jgi:nucleolar protein 6